MKYLLEGKRVMDFTLNWAGPTLAGMLADMGAEVIKVESREHLDALRLTPDNEERDIEKDPFFQTVNRSKLSITVDFTTDGGASLLKRLVSISNVVIEAFSPGVMKRHGLDYDSLREIKPDLIYVSMPGAGSYGPMADVVTYGPSIVALAGYDAMVGYPGERVIGTQIPFADPNASLHGMSLVLAALYHHERTGEGQYVEVPQLEAAISIIGEAVMEYVMNGRVPGTEGSRHPVMVPHNNYRCKGEDKWVSIAIRTEEEWKSFCQAIGNPDWTKQERFGDGYRRWQNQAELDELISQWTVSRSHYEVTHLLQQVGVAAAPVLDMEERLSDPHFQEREVYKLIEHPAIGTGWVPGPIWRLSETPAEVRRHAPLLGEHNQYVFGELLGMPQDEIDRLVEEKVIY